MICEAFAAALADDRQRFNALFAQARRRVPRLDGAEFLDILLRRIDPLIETVSQSEPDRAGEAVNAFYTIGLELLLRGLVGESDRYPHFEQQWSQLMNAVMDAHPAAAHELAGSLTNALFHLTTTPRCRPQAWVARLSAAAPQCATAANVRAAGQVAAWLSGMAHYRGDALALARRLPLEVVGRLLELDEPASDIVDQLASNRWLNPHHGRISTGIRIVAEAGGFRGFGCEFRHPPTVATVAEGFLVSDGIDQWLLTADAFGATFHRASAASATQPAKGPYRITKTGILHGPHEKKKLPLLASSSSHAASDDTLAVTLPHSHKVFLVSEAPA